MATITKRTKAIKPMNIKSIADLDKAVIKAKRARLKAVKKLIGSKPVQDYTFDTLDGVIHLSDLFMGKDDLILIHNMGRKCPYCTLWADGFTSLYEHLNDRASFVLSTPDSPQVQAEFAASRNWPFFMVSVRSGSFARDMGFEPKPGDFYPGVSVFHMKKDGTIIRTGAQTFGPGDDFCAAWPLFDLLKGGPGKWAPKYSYGTKLPGCGCGPGCTCGPSCDCGPACGCC